MKTERKINTIILAAGKGTRMKSDIPKVLHLLKGKPLLYYPIALARQIKSEKIIVVVGHQSHLVRGMFPDSDLIFVEQGQPLGTGHAIYVTRDYLKSMDSPVLILCGDVPLLRPETVSSFIDAHIESGAVLSVMTTINPEPGSYGRVVKDEQGRVVKIVEAKDASKEELRIKEINTGIYCADAQFLYLAVGKINNYNAQQEYYLTDIVAIAFDSGFKTAAFLVGDAKEVMGINTPEDLNIAEINFLLGDN